MVDTTNNAPELKHGKYSTYVLEKCRCEECRTANREYKRGWLARQALKAAGK
jgi:hypothetical protein